MNPAVQGIRHRIQVAWGLGRVELQERLGEIYGRKLTALSRRMEVAAARKRVKPLNRWKRISDTSFAEYTNDASIVRIHKLQELIPRNARILDIGIGFGYITGVVLRDTQPSYYCGIDLKELFPDATRDMLEHNGLLDSNVALEVRNVFEIDQSFGDRHKPNVVLMLEVLEHIEDPAKALRAVAGAVEPHTRFIFTVPMHGRLDGVWGHVSVFDRARLQRICRSAGLTIERVEPLHNTWSFVVARLSRSGVPLDESVDFDDSKSSNTFSAVPITGHPEQYRRGSDRSSVKLDRKRGRLHCQVRASAEGVSGGVRLEIRNPRVVRLELSAEPSHGIRELRIECLDDVGQTRVAWSANGSAWAEHAQRRTYVLRPGHRTEGLHRHEDNDVSGIRWFDVSVKSEANTELTFTVHRIAYIPEGRGK